MIDALSALSLYRQLEGLEDALKKSGDDQVNQFLAAYNGQEAFNSILTQTTEQCADAPEYLRSLSHIKPVQIPKGADRSAYPRFLTQVKMLRQAIGALLEYTLTQEQRERIGFK